MFRRFPAPLTATIVMMVLAGLVESASVISLAPLVDYLIHPDLKNASPLTLKVVSTLRSAGIPVSLWTLAGVFLFFSAGKNACTVGFKYGILRSVYAIQRYLTVGTFEDFFRARWLFFSANKQGTFLNLFIRELGVVGGAFRAIAAMFAATVQFTLLLAIPLYVSWQVTLISLLIAGLFAGPFVLLSRFSYRLGKETTATANEISAVIHESFGLAKLILGYGNQSKSVEALARAFDAHRRVAIGAQTLMHAIPSTYNVFGLIVVLITLYVSKKFGVPLSEAAVLLYAMLKITSPVGELVTQKTALSNFFPSYELVTALTRSARELRQPTGETPFLGFEREVAVEDLTFAYPGNAPVLIDINMRIPKGKMVALVGESGAGKSTLIDTLMGFNEPEKGRVAFDGVPLLDFDVNSYRRRIGYVPQETVLFNMTIRDNLCWANEQSTEEEIREACRLANADEFIDSFPEGYGTMVGDRGVRLSGGQAQRIALARAILRKPELLILDEATSSLDTKSERLIQKAVEKIARETTVVVIAHRLSTIMNADHIYVLGEGRIIEEGSYSTLVRSNGHFAGMASLQVLDAG